MNNYERKKQARIDYYKGKAAQFGQESDQQYRKAKAIGDFIPMGQPILLGHHSEARHRRDIARIDNSMRKSIQLDAKSLYYEHRAKAAENNAAISSDNPDAITELEQKLSKLERAQERMKAANKLVKKKDLEGLRDMGFNESQVTELITPDFAGRIGFPSYRLTNNNSEIRRIKQRIEQLRAQSLQKTTERELNGVRIVDNVEDNRLQLFFPEKPADKIRADLHSHGFKWSRYNGCWQRMRSNAANYWAEQIIKSM